MLFNVTYQVDSEEQLGGITDLPDRALLSVVEANCFTLGCTASVVSVDGTITGTVNKNGNVSWTKP